MDPVTSNIQANQHLKNENVLWVKKAQYDKQGCGNTSEIWNKIYYQVKRKKKQGPFFWCVKGESNLGGIDFYRYLLDSDEDLILSPQATPLSHTFSLHIINQRKVYQYPVNQLPVSKHIKHGTKPCTWNLSIIS